MPTMTIDRPRFDHALALKDAFEGQFDKLGGEDVELVRFDIFDYGKRAEIEVSACKIYRCRHFIDVPVDRGVDVSMTIAAVAQEAREWAHAAHAQLSAKVS